MDDVRWEPVTASTYEKVLRLQVTDEQRPFVAPNVRSLADAWISPSARPLALHSGEDVVGFALLEEIPSEPETMDIVRFMVDKRAQGRGLGRAALDALLARARAEGRTAVSLSVVPGNDVARGLYTAAGFAETGELDGDELVMRLALGGPPGP